MDDLDIIERLERSFLEISDAKISDPTLQLKINRGKGLAAVATSRQREILMLEKLGSRIDIKRHGTKRLGVK